MIDGKSCIVIRYDVESNCLTKPFLFFFFFAFEGYGEINNDKLSPQEAHHDMHRMSYLHQHLSKISEVTNENNPDK